MRATFSGAPKDLSVHLSYIVHSPSGQARSFRREASLLLGPLLHKISKKVSTGVLRALLSVCFTRFRKIFFSGLKGFGFGVHLPYTLNPTPQTEPYTLNLFSQTFAKEGLWFLGLNSTSEGSTPKRFIWCLSV